MTSPEAEVVRHRDFTLSPEPITFTIAPDLFQCVPEIPLDVLAELSTVASTSDTQRSANESLEKLKDLFDGVMLTDSAATFRARLKRGTQGSPIPTRSVCVTSRTSCPG